MLNFGCWDSDFQFDDNVSFTPVTAEAKAARPPEDWDLELSIGENHRNFSPNDRLPLNSTIVQCELAPSVPLLEYLDTNSTSLSTDSLFELPRPPMLFSIYMQQAQHHQGQLDTIDIIINTGVRRSLQKYSLAIKLPPRAVIPDVAFPQEIRNQRLRLNTSYSACLTRCAPKTGDCMVTWLKNIHDKVSSAIATVVRPSPEHPRKYVESERSPSKEVAFDEALRVAEMSYCNEHWRDCSAQTKSLVHCLDALARSSKAHQFNSRGSLRPSVYNFDLHCYQSCGRLARLVCRLVQRCDELGAIELIRTVRMCKHLHKGHHPPPFLPLDANDIATFCRGATAMVNAIRDDLLRAKSKLIIHESLAHLALVHNRPMRTSSCEHLCLATRQIFGGWCWCGALPPLPRSGILRFLDVAHVQEASELEVLVFADLHLEAMGYSPLTTERLVPVDFLEQCTCPGIWRIASTLHLSSDASQSLRSAYTYIVCESKKVSSLAPKGEWSSNASEYIEASLFALALILPFFSHARARAVLALGLGHLHGIEYFRDRMAIRLQEDKGARQSLVRSCNALHAMKELRFAEMLLFEVDLPACTARCGTPNHELPTTYCILTCPMGYTTLRALTRALEQRSKHAYAVLALDICLAVSKFHGNSNERYKLQRELCVVLMRQGVSQRSMSQCECVLRDQRKYFERLRAEADTEQLNALSFFILPRVSCVVDNFIMDSHEASFTIELLVIQQARFGTVSFPNAALQNFQTDYLQRQNICSVTVFVHEARFLFLLASVSAASILLRQNEANSTMNYLECALASCPTSYRRRIAILSHLVEGGVRSANSVRAKVSLRRISRLRKYYDSGSCGQQWNSYQGLPTDLACPLWHTSSKGRLISFCNDRVDCGQLAAQIELLQRAPKRALIELAPTVAAAEACVSRVGSACGFYTLGVLYELRGRAQASLARDIEFTAYPIHVDALVSEIDNLRFDDGTTDGNVKCSWSSRRYVVYANAEDVKIDALCSYRLALQCFKATDDSYCTGCAASSFAALKLDAMFLQETFSFPFSGRSSQSCHVSLGDVSLAARRALDIATAMVEPLLLLETYLNMAELLQICHDPVGAIAHWWEARELLLRLFVMCNLRIPVALIADLTTIAQIHRTLERMLRFLTMVADKAMIDENIFLFHVLPCFERDSTHKYPRVRSVDLYWSSHDMVELRSNFLIPHIPENDSSGALANSCWQCLVTIRANITRHTYGELTVSGLHHYNQDALRELATLMQQIRIEGPVSTPPIVPTVIAVHAAGTLIVYAPQLGWRHALAFGRCARGLNVESAALIGALTGTRRSVVAERKNRVEYRRAVLKQVSDAIALPRSFFSAAVAAQRRVSFFATLLCSERTQVLPWECISDTPLSRVVHIQAAFASTRITKFSKARASVVLKESTHDDIRHLLDLIIHDLSSSCHCHSGLCPTVVSKFGSVALKSTRLSSKLVPCAWWSESILSDNLLQVFYFGALPSSALHLPPRSPIQFHSSRKEYLFAPDIILDQVNTRVHAERSTNSIRTARTLSSALALPIIHFSLENLQCREAKSVETDPSSLKLGGWE